MRCEKCGAEWKISMTSGAQKCPFCGEILSEDIPYKEVVDKLYKNIKNQRESNEAYGGHRLIRICRKGGIDVGILVHLHFFEP